MQTLCMHESIEDKSAKSNDRKNFKLAEEAAAQEASAENYGPVRRSKEKWRDANDVYSRKHNLPNMTRWSEDKVLFGCPAGARSIAAIDLGWTMQVHTASKQDPSGTDCEAGRGGKKKSCMSSPALKLSPAKMRELAKGLFCDVSQNPDRGNCSQGLRTFTSKSEYYTYEGDRMIIAEEHFNMLMHAKLATGELSQNQIRDLAGNSMSMPLASLLGISMLLASSLPGLWQREMASDAFPTWA